MSPRLCRYRWSEGRWQISRVRCAWMCFHVSRKCLTPDAPLTSNLGCQCHFHECPLKMNMWTWTGGLQPSARWSRGPSWHLCLFFARYATVGYITSKACFFYFSESLWLKLQHQFVNTVRGQELAVTKVASALYWASISLPDVCYEEVNRSPFSFCQ